MAFKIGQKVTKYFGYCCNKICHQDLEKIPQSGHTVQGSNLHVNAFDTFARKKLALVT